jgi:hypothetical protein
MRLATAHDNLHDETEHVLIVKLIVGVVHECAAHEFARMFEGKLQDLHIHESILAIGSARFGSRSCGSKEVDVGYKLYFRGLEIDWPSFVTEFGVSESHANANLRANATYWLTYSDGKTHIVILLTINWIDRQILVKPWEEVPRTQPSWSTANYNCIPRMRKCLTLYGNVQYHGPSLEIPAQKLFDVLPKTFV